MNLLIDVLFTALSLTALVSTALLLSDHLSGLPRRSATVRKQGRPSNLRNG